MPSSPPPPYCLDESQQNTTPNVRMEFYSHGRLYILKNDTRHLSILDQLKNCSIIFSINDNEICLEQRLSVDCDYMCVGMQGDTTQNFSISRNKNMIFLAFSEKNEIIPFKLEIEDRNYYFTIITS